MEFHYKKTDHHKLFKSLEENPEFGIFQAQNFIPIYNRFFELSATNHNMICLNNHGSLTKIISQETNNIFNCSIKDDNDNDTNKNKPKLKTKKVYFKFSPLLDPLKYLIGKYDVEDSALLNLPAFDLSHNCNLKVKDYNNAAYVDSFFTYLSSQLLHKHGFSHGLDFYGSFLAMKTDFRINIADDIDYLNDSAFFRKNDKILYELEDVSINDMESDTRNYKKKLTFHSDPNDDGKTILQLSDIIDLNHLDTIVNNSSMGVPPAAMQAHDGSIDTNAVGVPPPHDGSIDTNAVDTNALELIVIDDLNDIVTKTKSSHGSTCSSRSSNTTVIDGGDNLQQTDKETPESVEGAALEEDSGSEKSGSGSGSGSGSEKSGSEKSGSGSDSGSEEEEDVLIAKIKTFPVQVIALENFETTLDHLMSHEDITDDAWDSIVMQILFSLITFQNAFSLTHNDLHTNNVMYIETDKKYLYYKLNHVYYKVPTFGKLFKIIDFGRAIYKFRGQTMCSDSYHPDGDAATQYNCEPYFNDKKPRLEPNFSFDLCRLGCALYDYLVDDEPKTKIVQIMLDWILDDKGRNILYKKNGDERYPDFKLYKMIARTVHKHVPIDVLNNAYFDKFIINKKELKKTTLLMDLDTLLVGVHP